MAKQQTRNIDEVQLGWQLPPPIYADHLTTVPAIANKNIKYVKRLELGDEALVVEAVEGQVFNIPITNIKYWK